MVSRKDIIIDYVVGEVRDVVGAYFSVLRDHTKLVIGTTVLLTAVAMAYEITYGDRIIQPETQTSGELEHIIETPVNNN